MSEEAKHTPGPWSERPNLWSTGGYIIGPNGAKQLASVNETLAGIGREECEANARIMAAAPQLLAACEAARDFGSDYALEMLDAAIAAAKGENNA